ncbi:NAD(P)-dependent oxidoreductase [Streptomyces sp. NPDC001796]|uniref:NAD(P)-dependent oxidoreductase n=1 Tax=Streptomyces sp. NPDC001796 TaxID=3364609 RepID=UPI0036884E98
MTADATDALLGWARWVVSTLPVTFETENFVDADRFDAVRGATLINAGRGSDVALAAPATRWTQARCARPRSTCGVRGRPNPTTRSGDCRPPWSPRTQRASPRRGT